MTEALIGPAKALKNLRPYAAAELTLVLNPVSVITHRLNVISNDGTLNGS